MIRVEGLTYTYGRSPKPTVADLSFHVERGEILGFLGPSGAGKSTTQRILTGLLCGYQGRVAILGRDLPEWGRDYYEHIGVSFELPHHFTRLTALENLSYFAALYTRPTLPPQEVLEALGLEDSAREPVGRFSKGMKNRLSFARALLHQPEILFLDEPTSGLDPVNARAVKDIILARKHAGNTVFLTTHDMSAASELCDRVAFIVDGSLRTVGAPRKLELEYGLPLVEVTYQVDGRTSDVAYPVAGLADNVEFHDLLRRDAVRSIHSKDATLEDVFIKVTGRGLA